MIKKSLLSLALVFLSAVQIFLLGACRQDSTGSVDESPPDLLISTGERNFYPEYEDGEMALINSLCCSYRPAGQGCEEEAVCS